MCIHNVWGSYIIPQQEMCDFRVNFVVPFGQNNKPTLHAFFAKERYPVYLTLSLCYIMQITSDGLGYALCHPLFYAEWHTRTQSAQTSPGAPQIRKDVDIEGTSMEYKWWKWSAALPTAFFIWKGWSDPKLREKYRGKLANMMWSCAMPFTLTAGVAKMLLNYFEVDNCFAMYSKYIRERTILPR